ncbi:MAG: hypothetical protein PVG72_11620 [Gammaproteobacteria bacterium]
MDIDWITALGVVTVFGIAGLLIILYSPAGNDFLPPWERYHRAFTNAQAARGEFLRSGFVAVARSVKERFCYQMKKLHIPLCPLCCAAK